VSVWLWYDYEVGIFLEGEVLGVDDINISALLG